MNIKKTLYRFGIKTSPNLIRAYWWSGEGNRNFGDVLTPYLIEKITGKKVILCSKNCFKPYYMVTGSILKSANKNAIIWGSGIIRRNEKIKKPKKILAVRGPITRKRLLELGYECPEVYGDPALLLPLFYKPKAKKKYYLGIIPNHIDYDLVKNNFKDKNILIINMLDPIERVIENIFSCKKILSSSLHGLIVSHAYSIPSKWVEFSDNLAGDGTKFIDYFLSVGITPYKPFNFRNKLPELKILLKLFKNNEEKIRFDSKKLLEACPFKKN